MDVSGYALITGAASGIGKACAARFLADGAAGVALLDISHDNLVSVKAELESDPKLQHQRHKSLNSIANGTSPACRIEIFPLDVSDENQVNTTVTTIASLFTRIDYVVNAAGIAMKHPGGAAHCSTPDWRRTLDVNLSGTFFVLRATARIMLTQPPILSVIDSRPLQRGSIVNFSSIQGVVGIPLSTAYAASKHAVIGLTKSASEDYAREGLRINAICPGYTETPLTTKNPLVLEAMRERVASAVPMGRMGRAEEIADAVVWLCGGRASFVTGTALMVDGGYTQR